jgi:hypothetical protein
MAHPAYLREKVRQVRRERHLTLDELVERFALPKTTVYTWIADLPISRRPHSTWPESARRKGSLAMQRKYRRLREEAYEEGRHEFSELVREATFRDFVCLYIAEGYKRSRNCVSICNSDPAVVRLGARWIRYFARNPVRYGIHYHADQDLRALTEFWGAELKVEPTSIKLQDKSNSNKLNRRTWRCRYGVLTVASNDTLFRARLQAWMDCLRRTWT